MKYGRARQVLQKQLINVVMKNGILTSTGYTDHYNYNTNSNNPYAVHQIRGSSNTAFYWDNAGNMTFMKDRSAGTKLFFWTEDNRMQALITDHSAAFYRYDAGGERELKLLATTRDVRVNGRDYKQPMYDDAVLYASGLITVERSGYKKHYFMEGERILTNIGGGGSPNIGPNEELATITEVIIEDISEKYFDKYVSSYFPEHVNEGVGNPLEIPGDLKNVPDLQIKFTNSVNQSVSDIPYYYVPDYLSSGSVITNATGDPVHVLSYIPFGEILLDLNNGFETPYKFAGYEHDQESGLSYASARYYAGMSRYPIFLSPDPLAEKFPWQSGYVYCSNNPIMRIDLTGLTDFVNEEGKIIYNDGIDNKEFRAVSAQALGDAFANGQSPYEVSRAITFEKLGGEFADMWNKSSSSNLERAGYVVFDFNNAQVKFEEVPVPNATSTGGNPKPDLKAGDKFAGGIVIANVHTHPTEHTYLGKNSTEGTVTDAMNFNNQYKASNSDGNRAKTQGANYTISKFNVDYFSPQGRTSSANNLTTRTKLQNNQFNLLKHALKQYGK